MTSSDIQADIAELQGFLEGAQRPKVKDVLSLQIRKWQSELISLEEEERKRATAVEKPETSPAAAPVAARPVSSQKAIVKELRQYAWDQSDKFMKLYVDMAGVHTAPEESMNTNFQSRYVKISATVGNITYLLAVGPFHSDVVPQDCKVKVKTDKILVMLKKEKEKETWPYVISKTTTKTPSPAPMDDSKDPSDGLMTMLKQMYEDGDEEMKRTIAKSMYQSQTGKGAGSELGDM